MAQWCHVSLFLVFHVWHWVHSVNATTGPAPNPVTLSHRRKVLQPHYALSHCSTLLSHCSTLLSYCSTGTEPKSTHCTTASMPQWPYLTMFQCPLSPVVQLSHIVPLSTLPFVQLSHFYSVSLTICLFLQYTIIMSKLKNWPTLCISWYPVGLFLIQNRVKTLVFY